MADAFGFDADITNVVPTDLNTTVATDNESGEHGTLLALFSQLNANDPDSLEQVIDRLADDLADDATFSNDTVVDIDAAFTDLVTSSVASNINAEAIENIRTVADIPDNTPPSGYGVSGLTNPIDIENQLNVCLLYTSPSPRDRG